MAEFALLKSFKLISRKKIHGFKIQKIQARESKYQYVLVKGQTPFYRTSNELEDHFSNMEHVHVLMIEHLNFGFEQTDIKLQTEKFFNRFSKSFLEQTPISFFRTSIELEHVHLLVMEFEHPIFGFEQSNIQL